MRAIHLLSAFFVVVLGCSSEPSGGTSGAPVPCGDDPSICGGGLVCASLDTDEGPTLPICVQPIDDCDGITCASGVCAESLDTDPPQTVCVRETNAARSSGTPVACGDDPSVCPDGTTCGSLSTEEGTTLPICVRLVGDCGALVCEHGCAEVGDVSPSKVGCLAQ